MDEVTTVRDAMLLRSGQATSFLDSSIIAVAVLPLKLPSDLHFSRLCSCLVPLDLHPIHLVISIFIVMFSTISLYLIGCILQILLI